MRFGGSVMLPYDSPQQWLGHVKELGYSAVVFPVDCSSPRQVWRDYAACCRDNDLVIGEVGVWRNTMDPDPAKREAHIQYAIRQLELAEEVGARCCVNISGALSQIWDGYHPEQGTQRYRDEVAAVTQRIIDAVQPKHTFFTLEPMPWMPPETPEEYLDLIAQVDRPAFAVHLDYANMICSVPLYRSAEGFIRHCFEVLGPHLRSVHAKDLILDDHKMPVCILETPPGEGTMPLTEVMRLAAAHPDPDLPVFVEHLPDHESYMKASRHIHACAAAAGAPLK